VKKLANEEKRRKLALANETRLAQFSSEEILRKARLDPEEIAEEAMSLRQTWPLKLENARPKYSGSLKSTAI